MAEEKIIYYDIETSGKYAQYCDIKLIGYAIGDELPATVENEHDARELRRILGSKEWIKVGYNSANFDDVVLSRFSYPVHRTKAHDLFLIIKTVCPTLPAYGMKFVSWFFFGDHHEPERRLHAWMQHNGCADMYTAPTDLLREYCLHDIIQTRRLWKLFYPTVCRERHRNAYENLELPFVEVLHEIMGTWGGDCVNVKQIRTKIRDLERGLRLSQRKAYRLTRGAVSNAGSTKQVASYLRENENIALKLSDKGNLILRKDDLLTLLDLDNPDNDKSRLARICYDIRDVEKQLGYLRAYRRAALYELRSSSARKTYRTSGYVRIPKSYSLSGARSRRILSSSKFGINFQNQNDTGKEIQLVPPGWVAFSIDESQIENVVHIWASDDSERRASYEANVDWNEYVWLCGKSLGDADLTKKDVERIKSTANPSWSLYKQYKTAKLAINFGMGKSEFQRRNRLTTQAATVAYNEIHRICPAIKDLINTVRNEIYRHGYIQDPWGHVYSGDPDTAYKVVAHFIQGCGTGSVTKAIGRAIWDVLQEVQRGSSRKNNHSDISSEEVNTCLAIMTGLIHDSFEFRLSLALSDSVIIQTLHRCLYCAEDKFSSYFDDIPIRAKLSISITNMAELEEINHYHMRPSEWEETILKKFIWPARKNLAAYLKSQGSSSNMSMGKQSRSMIPTIQNAKV